MKFNALKGFIREQGLNLKEFAIKAGISPSTAWAKLNGKYEWTRVDMLAVKEAFNLNSEDLIRLFYL